MWGLAAAVAVGGGATAFVVVLMAWQGVVYACGPYMAWLSTRSQLPPELERRRRTERFRERLARIAPYSVAGLLLAAGVATLLFLGGSNPGSNAKSPFSVPHRAPGDRGPLTNVVSGSHASPTPAGPTGVTGPTGPSVTTGVTGPSGTSSTSGPTTSGTSSPPTSAPPTSAPPTSGTSGGSVSGPATT